MKQAITEAERSMQELGFLFTAEQQRLSNMFGYRLEAFLAEVLPEARQHFEILMLCMSAEPGPRYRRHIFHEAQEVAKRHIMPWLKPEQEEAERQYRRVALRFVEMANAFVAKLSQAGIPELARMPNALDSELSFRVRSKFTFMEFIELAQPALPLRWLADFILGLVGGRKLIENGAREFLDRLLETNSTRVQSDILDRVQHSREQLESEIRKLLHQVSRIAEQALVRARTVQEEGGPSVESALQGLKSLEYEVCELSSAQISSD
jgi:nucleotide-binding universal stress UspA family protein